ncbi:endolytic transglycosylase MltG [Fulvivirgaceae bacterium BMA10]|uniref:Endolytic murein transglycosylase n=1 Tax=Splendidivirga corallicola TaxID=3051826 RepID=A0ABT8KJ01_9BACT|nr:endolytic transglycosylase MltG [Fulvivirgaceae bacterium BMA10]
MKRRTIIAVVVVTFSILLTTSSLYIYQTVNVPNILVEKEDSYLYIPGGASFKTVQDSLSEKEMVQDLVSFSFMAKLMKYQDNVKPGKYKLTKNMSNIEAIRLLRSGDQTPVNITFNNIRLRNELAEKITKELEMEANHFEVLLNDSTVASNYGFDKESFMVMFIPNTYEEYWTVSPDKLMERMNREYKNFWTEERINKAEALKMSPVEVSILASIVQAECSKHDELPKVAGLYINRLNRNIPLQADPTLIFAAQDFTIKRVLNKHKEIESPYNTYKYAGLPPGPISLPSIRAIDGVLNYEKHNFLYMCAKEDFSGYHNFASTLREHLNNARKYQRVLNKAKLFR